MLSRPCHTRTHRAAVCQCALQCVVRVLSRWPASPRRTPASASRASPSTASATSSRLPRCASHHADPACVLCSHGRYGSAALSRCETYPAVHHAGMAYVYRQYARLTRPLTSSACLQMFPVPWPRLEPAHRRHQLPVSTAAMAELVPHI